MTIPSIAVSSVTALALAAATAALLAQQTPVPAPPKLELALEIHVEVGTPNDVGIVPGGQRRLVPITGGTFTGSGLKGKVLPGGADHQLIQPDGFSQLEARYVLQTDEGELVYVTNRGMRHGPPEVLRKLNAGERVDPALIYFRTTATMEAAASRLQWMTRSVFVGVGERYPADVVIRFYRVL